MSRRVVVGVILLFVVLASVFGQRLASGAPRLPYTPVVTPNGSTLPWEIVDGIKEFHLTVEEIMWEMAPGMTIKAWGYNGSTPGPTIEVVQGDHVRFYVTNKLPEATAVHWHGVLLPSGMDGVQGLTQRGIPPGDTFVYEFTIHQEPGSQMYHSHGDEMVQMGMGAMGMLIIHPKNPTEPRVDRDFALMVSEWFVEPGSATPDVNVMADFNIFTFNSRAYPGTAPLVVKTGEHVRIRIGNVAQEAHPIHLHGYTFKVTGTDGGPIPASAQWPETTVFVAPGQTRDFEFVANVPGDWAMHCHRRHHPMNAMGHDVPNVLGVSQEGLEDDIRELLPGYMAMGEDGMHEMTEMHMQGPENTLPMMGGDGPFGSVGMGGMFTVLKVRSGITTYDDPAWYEHPAGTVSESIHEASRKPVAPSSYVCPMHPEVRQSQPGSCPKCGMTLQPDITGQHQHEGSHEVP